MRIHKAALVLFDSQEQKCFIPYVITAFTRTPHFFRDIITWFPIISLLRRGWAGRLVNPKYNGTRTRSVLRTSFVCNQFHFWFVVRYKQSAKVYFLGATVSNIYFAEIETLSYCTISLRKGFLVRKKIFVVYCLKLITVTFQSGEMTCIFALLLQTLLRSYWSSNTYPVASSNRHDKLQSHKTLMRSSFQQVDITAKIQNGTSLCPYTASATKNIANKSETSFGSICKCILTL